MSNNLKKYRELVGATQKDIGLRLKQKSDQRIISYYERGNSPGIDKCRELVSILNDLGADCVLDDVFPPRS